MAYTEKLSEQLVVSDQIGVVTTSNGSSAATGSAVDCKKFHRVIGYCIADWTTGGATTTNATASVKLVASTNSGFTGTSTTVTSSSAAQSATTTTGSTVASVSASGELIQSQRAAEDRYVKAIITITSGGANVNMNGNGMLLGDNSRYKPV